MSVIINKKPLTTGTLKYEIRERIIFIERMQRAEYNEEKMKACVKVRQDYSKEHPYPCIVFGKELLFLDQSARKYLAGEGSINVLSWAFVVEKMQGKLTLNFFIGTSKPPVPTRIFDSLEEAIEWSKQFAGDKSSNNKNS